MPSQVESLSLHPRESARYARVSVLAGARGSKAKQKKRRMQSLVSQSGTKATQLVITNPEPRPGSVSRIRNQGRSSVSQSRNQGHATRHLIESEPRPCIRASLNHLVLVCLYVCLCYGPNKDSNHRFKNNAMQRALD